MALRRYPYKMHHTWLTAATIGRIQPIFLQEVTPGDSWNGSSSFLVRVAPMDFPAFVAFTIHVHYFFVPHRIIFPEFEDIITGTDTSTQWPTFNITDTALDQFRLETAYGLGPAGAANSYKVSKLPFQAYNAVYNEFYRDQKLQAELTLDNRQIQKAWFPAGDYFAGSRNEIQQGTEETVDTSGATLGVTAIRDAFHRQRFRERRSQFGERYTDYLMAMGLKVPDSRLDRPEHVAACRGSLGISEVVATATSTSEKTGEYRGHGISGFNCPFRKRLFLEHGTLLGLMHVRPRLQLRKRVDRQFLAQSKDDFFQMELARDTQVPIYASELAAGITTAWDAVWGYTGRDEWLRSPRDFVAGAMVESAYESWSAAKTYTSTPSQTDVGVIAPFDHLFQDQTADAVKLFVYADHRIGKRSLVPRRPK